MINPTEKDIGREVVFDYEATVNAGNPLKNRVPAWRGVYEGPDLTRDCQPGAVRIQTKTGLFILAPEQLSWTLHGRVAMPTEHQYDRRAMRLRGAAALTEMLAVIGDEHHNDATVARLLVENELELRAVLGFALRKLAGKKGQIF